MMIIMKMTMMGVVMLNDDDDDDYDYDYDYDDDDNNNNNNDYYSENATTYLMVFGGSSVTAGTNKINHIISLLN